MGVAVNPEGNVPKITNVGGRLWILGIKTENIIDFPDSDGTTTIIKTTGGGQTELLGGLIYPGRAAQSSRSGVCLHRWTAEPDLCHDRVWIAARKSTFSMSKRLGTDSLAH